MRQRAIRRVEGATFPDINTAAVRIRVSPEGDVAVVGLDFFGCGEQHITRPFQQNCSAARGAGQATVRIDIATVDSDRTGNRLVSAENNTRRIARRTNGQARGGRTEIEVLRIHRGGK